MKNLRNVGEKMRDEVRLLISEDLNDKFYYITLNHNNNTIFLCSLQERKVLKHVNYVKYTNPITHYTLTNKIIQIFFNSFKKHVTHDLSLLVTDEFQS